MIRLSIFYSLLPLFLYAWRCQHGSNISHSPISSFQQNTSSFGHTSRSWVWELSIGFWGWGTKVSVDLPLISNLYNCPKCILFLLKILILRPDPTPKYVHDDIVGETTRMKQNSKGKQNKPPNFILQKEIVKKKKKKLYQYKITRIYYL